MSEYVPCHKKPLSYLAAYQAFKRLLKFADLDPSLYALHSPRIGGATDAFAAGVPDYIIDRQGRWKSPSMKYRYCQVPEQVVAEGLNVVPHY